ncbi:hypothetical protein HKX48_009465, partial [Thoreauomyces humboldtii]
MESCLINQPPTSIADPEILTLVLHFDDHIAADCEAATLVVPRPTSNSVDSSTGPLLLPAAAVRGMTVLLSPSNFHARCCQYIRKYSVENCSVHPLLVTWKDLTAGQIRSFLRVDGSDTPGRSMPLYMSVVLELLRKYQKNGQQPTYAQFRNDVLTLGLTDSQYGPLKQRLTLLEAFLTDAEDNEGLRDHAVPLKDLFKQHHHPLFIADMTDPMISSSEASGIFDIILSAFLGTRTDRGKLVVLDEAHKYLSPGGSRHDDGSGVVMSGFTG